MSRVRGLREIFRIWPFPGIRADLLCCCLLLAGCALRHPGRRTPVSPGSDRGSQGSTGYPGGGHRLLPPQLRAESLVVKEYEVPLLRLGGKHGEYLRKIQICPEDGGTGDCIYRRTYANGMLLGRYPPGAQRIQAQNCAVGISLKDDCSAPATIRTSYAAIGHEQFSALLDDTLLAEMKLEEMAEQAWRITSLLAESGRQNSSGADAASNLRALGASALAELYKNQEYHSITEAMEQQAAEELVRNGKASETVSGSGRDPLSSEAGSDSSSSSDDHEPARCPDRTQSDEDKSCPASASKLQLGLERAALVAGQTAIILGIPTVAAGVLLKIGSSYVEKRMNNQLQEWSEKYIDRVQKEENGEVQTTDHKKLSQSLEDQIRWVKDKMRESIDNTFQFITPPAGSGKPLTEVQRAYGERLNIGSILSDVYQSERNKNTADHITALDEAYRNIYPYLSELNETLTGFVDKNKPEKSPLVSLDFGNHQDDKSPWQKLIPKLEDQDLENEEAIKKFLNRNLLEDRRDMDENAREEQDTQFKKYINEHKEFLWKKLIQELEDQDLKSEQAIESFLDRKIPEVFKSSDPATRQAQYTQFKSYIDKNETFLWQKWILELKATDIAGMANHDATLNAKALTNFLNKKIGIKKSENAGTERQKKFEDVRKGIEGDKKNLWKKYILLLSDDDLEYKGENLIVQEEKNRKIESQIKIFLDRRFPPTVSDNLESEQYLAFREYMRRYFGVSEEEINDLLEDNRGDPDSFRERKSAASKILLKLKQDGHNEWLYNGIKEDFLQQVRDLFYLDPVLKKSGEFLAEEGIEKIKADTQHRKVMENKIAELLRKRHNILLKKSVYDMTSDSDIKKRHAYLVSAHKIKAAQDNKLLSVDEMKEKLIAYYTKTEDGFFFFSAEGWYRKNIRELVLALFTSPEVKDNGGWFGKLRSAASAVNPFNHLSGTADSGLSNGTDKFIEAIARQLDSAQSGVTGFNNYLNAQVDELTDEYIKKGFSFFDIHLPDNLRNASDRSVQRLDLLQQGIDSVKIDLLGTMPDPDGKTKGAKALISNTAQQMQSGGNWVILVGAAAIVSGVALVSVPDLHLAEESPETALIRELGTVQIRAREAFYDYQRKAMKFIEYSESVK